MLVLCADNLRFQGITHGFFGRSGGVSTGIYRSLNCGPGSGDSPDAVAENRRRVVAAMGTEHRPRKVRSSFPSGRATKEQIALVTLAQCHGIAVRMVAEPWNAANAPQADAMVTGLPGVALGILTADCAPVLFADAQARVIGAAHAGWKGAFGDGVQSGVLEAALEAMGKLGAARARIKAAIGPCISSSHYEIGPEFHTRFLAADPANECFFGAADRPVHRHFDLQAYIVHRLGKAGLTDIEALSACTYAREEDFFSFRRAVHRSEKDYGREVSVIALMP